MEDNHFDIIAIGGGTAGIAVVQTSLRRKAKVLLIEEARIGGDCTFTGCVPSKTFIEAVNQGLPFAVAMQRVKTVVEEIASTEDAGVFRSSGATVEIGAARFVAPKTLEVNGRQVTGERVVIATGTRPRLPEVSGLSDANPLTNETVFDLTDQPKSLIVIGGGPIGCELAQAFARCGTQVTVVSRTPRLLPKEESAASAVIEKVFLRDGIKLCLGVEPTSVESRDGLSTVSLSNGDKIDGERILIATGRTATTDQLNLASAQVEVDDKGFIKTDEHLATSASDVYAAGDVTGRLMFTHAAYEMGSIASHNAFAGLFQKKFESGNIPWVTFTNPEVARVGMSESEAAVGNARVAELPLSEVDRAITAGQTDGFVKLLIGPRKGLGNAGGGQFLGATIVAPRAGEMIHEIALAMQTNMFAGRVAQTVHAYPTWSMAVRQAAAQLFVEVNGRRARPAKPD